MDVSKVNHYLDEFAKITRKGGRLGPDQRELLDAIHAAKRLDRVDASVLVLMPHGDSVVWEEHEAVNDYQVSPDGVLSILVGGRDVDGDWCTERAVAYPDGRWLKFETVLTAMDNPYYIDPDKADPREVDGYQPGLH